MSRGTPPLACAFCLGPVRESLGIKIPLVWLANLTCDFCHAYERWGTATTATDSCSAQDEDNLDNGGDSNNKEWEGGTGTARAGRRQRTTTQKPRLFAPCKQWSLKALQLSYRKARHSGTGGRGGGEEEGKGASSSSE